VIRWKAQNAPGTHEYYTEPWAVQHLWHWVKQTAGDGWHLVLYLTSKKRREDMARQYNRALFGNIPTSQIVVTDSETGELRPLRDDERTWPE
jgi:hypothetical protein